FFGSPPFNKPARPPRRLILAGLTARNRRIRGELGAYSPLLFAKLIRASGATFMAVSEIMLAARLNDQAEIFKEAGRYAEAEPLYRQALAICAKTRGLEHPSVAL